MIYIRTCTACWSVLWNYVYLCVHASSLLQIHHANIVHDKFFCRPFTKRVGLGYSIWIYRLHTFFSITPHRCKCTVSIHFLTPLKNHRFFLTFYIYKFDLPSLNSASYPCTYQNVASDVFQFCFIWKKTIK